MNQLVNEAVKDDVRRRNREVERNLESTLASLRAYRERDPDFAAQALFRKALATNRWPRTVTLDGHVPSHRALRLLRARVRMSIMQRDSDRSA
jgi:hypothetical protein